MPESIFVQVGQCGNQVGTRFWNWAGEEAKEIISHKHGQIKTTLDSFFKSSENAFDGKDTPKARAVLVDMEEGVINSIMREKKYADMFDKRLQVTDVSGSGNNWACGFYEYGKSHGKKIRHAIRKAAEDCDCLESFFLLHSVGGGTGSGLGSYAMTICADEYPDVLRFVFPIYPSDDDDVVTSPYNSVLSTHYLTENATCVFPQSNQSLCSLINRSKLNLLTKDSTLTQSSAKAASKRRAASGSQPSKPFDLMNDMIAQFILNLTACARFEGPLNLDLSDVATNMVPFPKLLYLMSSQAPIAGAPGPFSLKVESLFEEAFSAKNQLFGSSDVHINGLQLANGLLCRGNIQASEIRNGVARLSRKNRLVSWNPDGWKTGQCSVGPLTSSAPSVVVALSNSTSAGKSFETMKGRFQSLFAHRAYIHHYERVGMEKSEISDAIESLNTVIEGYKSAEIMDNTAVLHTKVL